ncbi:hypothetical protein [Labilithrix luteola]|nr:hypothetical protein [Labilithrix luteola]
MRWTLACLGGLLLVSADDVASAQVEVHDTGSKVDARKLDALVALELGEQGTSIDVVVTIADDATSAELVVRDEALSAERHAVVDLSGVTDVERIIALSVGELARSAGEPPPPPPLAPSPPPSPPPRDAARPESSRPVRAPYVLAQIGLRTMFSGGATVFTPRVEGGLSLSPSWRAGAFGYYGRASADDVLGSVAVDMVGAGVSTTFDFVRSDRVLVGTGPRLELGWMWGRGEGVGASTSSTPTFAATWELQAFTRIVRSAGVVVALDLGFAGPALDLHANDASDRSVLNLAGPYAGLSLGLGILPSRVP